MNDAMPVAEIVKTLSYDHDRMREVGTRLLKAVDSCDFEAVRGDLLEFQLIQDSHFWFQDRLMEAAAYPDTERHMRRHKRLHSILRAVNGVLCSGSFSALSDEFGSFIEESLAHIHEMDDPFHQYLIKEKSG
jgi:hemerythrin